MIREYRSPKTPFRVEVAVNPGKQKSARIDWGFFMQKVYPNIDTTFQTINFNEYATYTVTIGHSSLKNTYTNPRRPINFSDYHIHFSKDDQLEISLERDTDSGFVHTFGAAGQGMQEHMDLLANNADEFIGTYKIASNPEKGTVRLQSFVKGGKNGISEEKINDALEAARTSGKSLAHSFREAFIEDEDFAITTIASPAEGVPQIAKRTERKRR